MNDDHNTQEIDRLKYHGYSIPIWIIVPWIFLIFFCIYYLVKFMWPELNLWINQP